MIGIPFNSRNKYQARHPTPGDKSQNWIQDWNLIRSEMKVIQKAIYKSIRNDANYSAEEMKKKVVKEFQDQYLLKVIMWLIIKLMMILILTWLPIPCCSRADRYCDEIVLPLKDPEGKIELLINIKSGGPSRSQVGWVAEHGDQCPEHPQVCQHSPPALRISFDDISLYNYRVIFQISLKYQYRIFFENITQY